MARHDKVIIDASKRALSLVSADAMALPLAVAHSINHPPQGWPSYVADSYHLHKPHLAFNLMQCCLSPQDRRQMLYLLHGTSTPSCRLSWYFHLPALLTAANSPEFSPFDHRSRCSRMSASKSQSKNYSSLHRRLAKGRSLELDSIPLGVPPRRLSWTWCDDCHTFSLPNSPHSKPLKHESRLLQHGLVAPPLLHPPFTMLLSLPNRFGLAWKMLR